jgi:hypothetical protein
MKARILTSEKAVRDKVREEYQKYKDEVYREVVEDVIPQVLAILFLTLHNDFGFGKTRLRKVISGMKAYFKLMNTEIFNHKLTTLDCLQDIKDDYGIDLDEEIRRM